MLCYAQKASILRGDYINSLHPTTKLHHSLQTWVCVSVRMHLIAVVLDIWGIFQIKNILDDVSFTVISHFKKKISHGFLSIFLTLIFYFNFYFKWFESEIVGYYWKNKKNAFSSSHDRWSSDDATSCWARDSRGEWV